MSAPSQPSPSPLERRVAHLEAQLAQLDSRLEGLAEHVEYRFTRQHERTEAVDDDARRRDHDLEADLDRVRGDVAQVERSVQQTGRGW